MVACDAASARSESGASKAVFHNVLSAVNHTSSTDDVESRFAVSTDLGRETVDAVCIGTDSVAGSEVTR